MSQATLSELCRRAAAGPDTLSDAELLRRFAVASDDAAFAALVRRHGRVVWGAATRRAGDYQTAEDVFQATFLALARRAGRLHGHTSLAGWLYTVGVRLARRAARRPKPVPAEVVPDHRPDPLDTLSARELLAALDDEIARLPKAFRLPVVLCCLDGLSRDEAAQRLGCSFGALKGRLERGRELLRRRLATRGISLSAVLGGLVVVPAAIPPEVVAGTANAVLGGSPRPAAAALAGSLGTGRAAGLVTAATIVLLGLGLALMPGGAEPKPPAKDPDPAPAGETLVIRVLRDGKPAAGVTVWAAVRPPTFPGRPIQPKPQTSGADGAVRVPIDPDVPLSAAAFARDADGRIGEASVYEHTLAVNGPPVIHLVPVGELTGRLRTADGKPVAGAEVVAVQFTRPDDGHEPARPNHLSVPPFLNGEYTTKTDADGRFRIRGVPVGYRVYSPLKTDGFGSGFLELQANLPADVTLLPAGSLRLKLAGPADAKGAKGLGYWLQTGTPGGAGAKFVPQVNGTLDGSAEVTIPNVAPGRYRIEVRPDAKYPVRVTSKQEVVVNPGATAELAATVEPMARVTGRVVDAESGRGVPKTTVYLEVRDGTVRDGAFAGWVETDADGRFVGYGPAGRWVWATVHNPPAGYATPPRSGDVRTIPQAKLDQAAPQALPDIKLRRAVALRARVVDHAGKPVGGATVWTGQMSPPPSHPVSFTTRPDGSITLPDLGPDDVIALRVRKRDVVNLPAPVELGKQDGPVTVELNETHACRVRGRVTDDAGKPLAGVRAVVLWQYQGLGADASTSTQRGVGSVVTDADGRFTSGALWPTDRYQVSVSHERYSRGESKEVRGAAGQVHDLGTVRLVAIDKDVRGTVVDTAGKPLAGVTVMQRGDGPTTTSATTGPDGSFTLGGYFDRPGFVLVRIDGYRPAAAPAAPGGKPVTITLRKTTEPPAPLPPMDGYEAALAKLTRDLAEKLWADREHLGGFEKNVFRDMARFDPETAKRWRDAEKERTGGKVDLTRLLDEAELDRTLGALARDDLDEALARIPKADRWQVNRVLTLAEQLVGDDKAKALRAAEEAAVRARALDPAERPWPLARAGDLAIRAGNAAGGKKLVAEAIELATKLPAGERHEYDRGLVAAAVAAHDEPAAHKLIDGFGDPDRYNRALAGMVARLADLDPKRAEALFEKFRPGLGFASSEARLVLGFKLAATDPERAEAVVASTPEAKYRLLGFARLATLVAAQDRGRAWRLIDRAMDLLDKDARAVRGWSNFGGAPAIAALVAVRARQAGHPDVAGLVARALAHRTSFGWESRKERDEQTLSLATVLASADPPTARTVLSGIAPPAEFAKRAAGETRDWLFAAALADPEHAGLVVDAMWSAAKKRRGGGAATSNTGLIELLSVLTGPGDRLTNLATYGRIPSIPDRPE